MRRTGFSLIELTMVVVVVGILLAVGLPSFAGCRTMLRERAAREQLVRDLRDARQGAIRRHTPFVVGFDNPGAAGGTSYTIHQDLNADRRYQPGEPRAMRHLPAGTRVAHVALEPADTLMFDPRGTLRRGSSGGWLVVAAAAARGETVAVSRTGIVSLR